MLLSLLVGEDTYLFFGVVLLSYGLFAMGFAGGRFPEHDWDARDFLTGLPIWVQLGFVALIFAVIFLGVGLGGGGCEHGPCEPAGRP